MSDAQTTRGARKLGAAVERFGLAARIAGVNALDVGASTGGFTATLLAHGATEVTAIEVGDDQLLPALRSDPRVQLHERTDFRRASLSLAPGPFAFFTVDIGFMAARDVLRALAFRLAPGAEGIVLLKPQFELPTGEVRDGDVSDPALRARALDRFRERAEHLGFALLAQIDSQVAGGSGTIEMLLHLRFRERPAHLPRPGEKKPVAARTSRARRNAEPSTDTLAWFAIAAPGFEAMVADELRAIEQVSDVQPIHGGVEFRGPLAAGYAVNLESRAATRVLLRLGEVPAREFAQLRRRLGRLPLERWIAADQPLRVQVSARSCRLYHTKALAETLVLAASDRLHTTLTLHVSADEDEQEPATNAEHEHDRNVTSTRLPFGREPFTRVLLRGQDNRFALSVDTSGRLLHQRGARAETGRAPLRETLAAGVLWLAGYRGDEPLVNAMCGAGTIALEAADIACARSPGRMRAFAFEAAPSFDAAAYATERARLTSGELAAPRAPIYAFDRDARALERARRNAARAAADEIAFEQADLNDYTPPCERGLIVLNPPYGRRLSTGDARAFFGALGETLRTRWRGWRVAVLIPPGLPDKALGLRGARAFPLRHGGLHVRLLVAELGAHGS